MQAKSNAKNREQVFTILPGHKLIIIVISSIYVHTMHMHIIAWTVSCLCGYVAYTMFSIKQF